MTKKNSYQYSEEDKEILAELTDPNYEGSSFTLPENPTALEKAKYEVCQGIIDYKLKNESNIEELAQKIQLSRAETKRLLRYRIDEFTLDRLVTYANKLFPIFELGITKAKVDKHKSVQPGN